ncbi:GumC family protein [Thiocapsa marina]|uniref:GumC family protein n=1 Tax=Thiocapsa marina TaxID=244573 RepID=UPI0011121D2C|nr:lipopolysaccharide biosynthesis protein [Thiocapsa marina]
MATIKRRRWYFVLPFAFVLLGITLLAYSLPAVYRSTGKILIEQQGLPADLVRSTVTSYADERIAGIQQRVMTAANLVAIMDRHGLYPDIRRGSDNSSALQLMRRAVTLEMISADMVDPRTGRPTQATIAFSISFDADSPQIAQAVAADLVELYLAENLKERQEVTQEASRFLDDEAARISKDVAAIEARLAALKTESGSSLPEMMSVNLQALQRLHDRLRDLDQSINALTESSILLEGELARTSPYSSVSLPGGRGERVLDPREQLKVLEAQSLELSARYSVEHPDRIKVERELSALRSALRNESRTTSTAPDADNPAYIQLRARIIANDAQLSALRQSRGELEEQVQAYEERISEAPAVEQAYLALTRDYESALSRYQEVRSKLMDAKLAESLETESKGERFTLIEPPALSPVPVKPNRSALLFLGLVLATGSGVGSVILRQSFDKGIYGAQALARIAGSPPLGVIPIIETVSDRSRRNRRRLIGGLGAAVVLVIVVLIVHFLVAPLDVLLGITASGG